MSDSTKAAKGRRVKFPPLNPGDQIIDSSGGDVVTGTVIAVDDQMVAYRVAGGCLQAGTITMAERGTVMLRSDLEQIPREKQVEIYPHAGEWSYRNDPDFRLMEIVSTGDDGPAIATISFSPHITLESRKRFAELFSSGPGLWSELKQLVEQAAGTDCSELTEAISVLWATARGNPFGPCRAKTNVEAIREFNRIAAGEGTKTHG